jgi:hypothetical protein
MTRSNYLVLAEFAVFITTTGCGDAIIDWSQPITLRLENIETGKPIHAAVIHATRPNASTHGWLPNSAETDEQGICQMDLKCTRIAPVIMFIPTRRSPRYADLTGQPMHFVVNQRHSRTPHDFNLILKEKNNVTAGDILLKVTAIGQPTVR